MHPYLVTPHGAPEFVTLAESADAARLEARVLYDTNATARRVYANDGRVIPPFDELLARHAVEGVMLKEVMR